MATKIPVHAAVLYKNLETGPRAGRGFVDIFRTQLLDAEEAWSLRKGLSFNCDRMVFFGVCLSASDLEVLEGWTRDS